MKQFAINGKYMNGYDYCLAIIEKDSEGNRSVYSYVAPVYKDPDGGIYEYPDDTDYTGDDESWKDEPAFYFLWLYEAEEPIEFTDEDEAKKEMIKEFLKTHTFVRNCDNSVDFDWYETEEERLAREAEEERLEREFEEAKQAFVDSWKEDERNFFKSQLINCDYEDPDDATVDRIRKAIERNYELWHERNSWVKTWSDFLDGENVIGYLWGNL